MKQQLLEKKLDDITAAYRNYRDAYTYATAYSNKRVVKDEKMFELRAAELASLSNLLSVLAEHCSE